MNELIETKKEYSLKTQEGQENLRNYIELYNKNIDKLDPLAKQIGIEEALAITNIEEYIRSKSQIAEIVRESIEIGYTVKNFYTNTIFTFARTKLKKAGCNAIIRMQVENYIKFRLHITDKIANNTEKDLQYKNITSYSINNTTYYYNNITDKELQGKELDNYLQYLKVGDQVV